MKSLSADSFGSNRDSFTENSLLCVLIWRIQLLPPPPFWQSATLRPPWSTPGNLTSIFYNQLPPLTPLRQLPSFLRTHPVLSHSLRICMTNQKTNPMIDSQVLCSHQCCSYKGLFLKKKKITSSCVISFVLILSVIDSMIVSLVQTACNLQVVRLVLKKMPLGIAVACYIEVHSRLEILG